MELSIIPKPVSIKYTEGVFSSELDARTSMPPVIKKEENPQGIDEQNNEAYKLTILKDNITLQAANSAGMFNGEQTLRQLVLSGYKDGPLTLPCAEITDYPRFSWQ
ncbi:MAG: glycoside hydrolase family 20 zincin-like fold domain-containing protein [Treponema sp.]|jgi:N-acetyl-beta-hexosaminidase|nr:glycoside hydrolase family 20 zincin-like fold domain-containing protein [Treponema sp.]